MKTLLTILISLYCVQSFSQSQADLNKDTNSRMADVDKELNLVYNQVLIDYKSDTLFTQNLKASQRIWIQFRDAELAMRYPAYPKDHYGSVQTMCRNSYLAELSAARLETLKQWLNGVEEGDVCAGSMKMKVD